MTAIRTLRTLRRLAVFAFTLAFPLAALAAGPITGVVMNRTTNKPSAGDTVVLIRLAQGMQEATRTTTDARGRYTLEVPDDGIHLVRVMHDKANYFQPAPPGTTSVNLDVYNAAAKVKGVSSEADVMRIQSDPGGNTLHVVENFFIKNDSNPPMTQFSNQPFDFWLPEGAVIEGSAALGPGGMPVQAAPVPLTEKNHYTFLFPLRPGETRFQITYHLPYSGSFAFSPRMTGTTDTVAIMLPKSMTFAPAADTPYTSVTDEPTAQTYVARNVSPSQPMGFTLSGSGQLPRDSENPDQGSGGDSGQGQASQPAGDSGQPLPETENTMPGRGLQNPLDPSGNRDPWAKYKWWILGCLALLLAAAAGVLLRRPAGNPLSPPVAGAQPAAKPVTHDVLLLQALKEELFLLETERLQHRIGEAEYMEHKAALERVLLRALGRSEAVPAAISITATPSTTA